MKIVLIIITGTVISKPITGIIVSPDNTKTESINKRVNLRIGSFGSLVIMRNQSYSF